MNMFLIVIAIVTNAGELQMDSYPVDKCPEAAAFTATMDKMVTNKEMLGWNAICIPNGVGV